MEYEDDTTVGSSPRVWGQVLFSSCPYGCLRIIPTRMGTRIGENCVVIGNKDHPHAYGDKSFPEELTRSIPGSSPRVWGQVLPTRVNKVSYGIIPTRMGTRLKKSRKIAVLQNQPLRFPLTFHRSFV